MTGSKSLIQRSEGPQWARSAWSPTGYSRPAAAVQRPSTISPKAQAFDFFKADDYLDKTMDWGLVPVVTVGVAIGLKAPVLASMV
jgi:hypothetical protein